MRLYKTPTSFVIVVAAIIIMVYSAAAATMSSYLTVLVLAKKSSDNNNNNPSPNKDDKKDVPDNPSEGCSNSKHSKDKCAEPVAPVDTNNPVGTNPTDGPGLQIINEPGNSDGGSGGHNKGSKGNDDNDLLKQIEDNRKLADSETLAASKGFIGLDSFSVKSLNATHYRINFTSGEDLHSYVVRK